MKQRTFSMILLFAFVLALGSAAFVSQRASAACYDSSKNPVPCPPDPNRAKKLATAVPPSVNNQVPQPTTQAPVSVQSVVVATPNASQLAALCAQLPAVQGGSTGPSGNNTVGGGGGPGQPGSTTGGTPPSQTSAGFIWFELGGALLGGILIGLLLPAVRRRVNGDGRGWSGPITTPGGNSAGFDVFTQQSGKVFPKMGSSNFPKLNGDGFPKQGEAGFEEWAQGGGVGGQGEAAAAVDMFQKGSPNVGYQGEGNKIDGGSSDKRGEAGLNYSKQGEAGMDDWERGGSFDKRGEAGFQDLHQKASGGTFDKDAKTGFLKQGGAQWGDGSVHNMDNQFQKGSDAHITDGTSINGDG
jgi:hypothetical protein